MAAVAVGVIAFFVFMASRFGQPQMQLLYRGLDLNDSADIVARLETSNVPFVLRQNGGEILVPANQVLRLRMTMAQEGLPSGGSVGYEVFDRSDGIGTTTFVQNVNLLRALEGELARTIRTLDRVDKVRVHLVMPKRGVFDRDRRRPSASIVLKLRGGRELSSDQVAAIRNLAAAAVPELDPGRIAIVDARGRLLARAGDAAGESVATGRFQELRIAQERRIKQSVEALLGQTVGYGGVLAEVTVELDFDRVTTNAEQFDPESQVARSTQTVEDSSASSETDAAGAVTIETNLPEEDADPDTGQSASSNTGRTEETVNFEISRTLTNTIREAGLVRRISIAVVVDGLYETAEDGTRSYQPRSEVELETLTSLVKSAIGFDEDRGDLVDVVNLRFADLGQPLGEAGEIFNLFGLDKADLFKIAETLVLGLIAILVLLLVVRPMMTRVLGAAVTGGNEAVAALAGPAGTAAAGALPAPGTAALPAPGAAGTAALAAPQAVDQSAIDLEQVEGRVNKSSIKKIGEIVDKHPDEAIAIMRTWMYEDG